MPLSTLSLQPSAEPKVDVRFVSPSAPQLTLQPDRLPAPRLPEFPASRDTVKPERCDTTILTPDQLSKLGTLALSEAIAFINSCLPQESPQLAVLLHSVYHWSQQQNLDGRKTGVLLTIYSKLLQYVLESPWRCQNDVYSFFKECLLRHSVQHSPKSEKIFQPEESKAILLNFCNRFLTVLPLIRLNGLPNYRVQFTWETPSE